MNSRCIITGYSWLWTMNGSVPQHRLNRILGVDARNAVPIIDDPEPRNLVRAHSRCFGSTPIQHRAQFPRAQFDPSNPAKGLRVGTGYVEEPDPVKATDSALVAAEDLPGHSRCTQREMTGDVTASLARHPHKNIRRRHQSPVIVTRTRSASTEYGDISIDLRPPSSPASGVLAINETQEPAPEWAPAPDQSREAFELQARLLLPHGWRLQQFRRGRGQQPAQKQAPDRGPWNCAL